MKTVFSNALFIDECLDVTDDANRWSKDCLDTSGNKHQQLVNGVRIWSDRRQRAKLLCGLMQAYQPLASCGKRWIPSCRCLLAAIRTWRQSYQPGRARRNPERYEHDNSDIVNSLKINVTQPLFRKNDNYIER